VQETIKTNITQLQNKLEDIKKDKDEIEGKLSLLSEQFTDCEQKVHEIKTKRELYTKSVELVNLVQKTSREKIKKGFEKIVTYGLRSIYRDDYRFKLEFGRRGNLGELEFNIITPQCKEAFDPLLTSGGGILDIISVALRVALLESVIPKNNGFIIFDESFKHLSQDYIENAKNFLRAITKKMNRQIIMVTHKEQFLENANKVIKL